MGLPPSLVFFTVLRIPPRSPIALLVPCIVQVMRKSEERYIWHDPENSYVAAGFPGATGHFSGAAIAMGTIAYGMNVWTGGESVRVRAALWGSKRLSNRASKAKITVVVSMTYFANI